MPGGMMITPGVPALGGVTMTICLMTSGVGVNVGASSAGARRRCRQVALHKIGGRTSERKQEKDGKRYEERAVSFSCANELTDHNVLQNIW